MELSTRLFKFGDSRIFRSLGRTTPKLPVLAVNPWGEEITAWLEAEVGVIQTEIPLLLSQRAMRRLGFCLDFVSNRLTLKGGTWIQLGGRRRGHLSIPIFANRKQMAGDPFWIMVASEVPANKTFPDENIVRSRRNLPRANVGAIVRVLEDAYYEAVGGKIKMSISCGRIQQNVHTQPPLIKEYLPGFAGHTAGSDIFFPISEKQSKTQMFYSYVHSPDLQLQDQRRI